MQARTKPKIGPEGRTRVQLQLTHRMNMCPCEQVPRFQIRFDRATKNWILQADGRTIPFPLIFGSDGKGGGHLGLYGAICMAMSKGGANGGD